MTKPLIVVITDNRVLTRGTADVIAKRLHRKPAFIFKSSNSRAVYIFGRLVYSKGWS